MRILTPLLTFALTLLAACGGGDPARGRQLLQEKACTACHSVGGGDRQGPDLAGVADKYDRERLRQWLHDPEVIYRRTGKTPINEGFPPMPRFPLTDQEIEDLTAYLATLEKGASETRP